MDTKGNILIYQNEKGDTKVDAYFNDDTIWMSSANLFVSYINFPNHLLVNTFLIYI